MVDLVIGKSFRLAFVAFVAAVVNSDGTCSKENERTASKRALFSTEIM
jgi:hypothetical protein